MAIDWPISISYTCIPMVSHSISNTLACFTYILFETYRAFQEINNCFRITSVDVTDRITLMSLIACTLIAMLNLWATSTTTNSTLDILGRIRDFVKCRSLVNSCTVFSYGVVDFTSGDFLLNIRMILLTE